MSAAIFSGSSRYSVDFQSVIDRAIGIASLPTRQLETQRETLGLQAAAWNSIDSRFTALSASFANISTALGAVSYQVSNSNEGVLSARLGVSPSEGSYSIEVLNTGRRTATISNETLPRVWSPSSENISPSNSFTLTVDGTEYTLSGSNGSLSGLAAQINQSGAAVVATVINFGTATSPDYRLSVQGTKLGDITISLTDGTQVLVSTIAQGFSALYRINGIPTDIPSDSRTVSIGPGLDVDLKDVGTAEVEIRRGGQSVGDALAELVTNFNATVDELDTHRGAAAGPLSGESLLQSLSRALRQVSTYSGTGSISSLEDLGLSLNQFGRLNFDRSQFDSVATSDLDGVVNFLVGPTGSGGGFVKAAEDALAQLQDATDGELRNTIDLVRSQIRNQDRLIAESQERVALMRETLLSKMAAADALIASLEQQVLFMNGMFEAMRAQRE